MKLTDTEREKIILELTNCMVMYFNNDDIKQLLIQGFKGLKDIEDDELVYLYKKWCKQ